MQYGYRPQLRMPQPTPISATPGEVGFDGKMLRKAMARKTVDYNASTIRSLEVKCFFYFIKINISFLNFF
jgi:hypothetical protein